MIAFLQGIVPCDTTACEVIEALKAVLDPIMRKRSICDSKLFHMVLLSGSCVGRETRVYAALSTWMKSYNALLSGFLTDDPCLSISRLSRTVTLVSCLHPWKWIYQEEDAVIGVFWFQESILLSCA